MGKKEEIEERKKKEKIRRLRKGPDLELVEKYIEENCRGR